jgi:multidrug efflux pump subunit AcrA (membrane-fusion protein)
MFLGVFLIGVWWLMRPYPLTIEADAVLEPISRRAIHASADGFIEELFVEDGQSVQKNQKLVRLRSPALDLQIEETLGQKLAFAEKRNGLRVAVNQLSPSSPDSSAAQTRLSADIMLLETQEKLANEKLTFLMNEKSKLTIESPIEGVIVSRDLRRELEFRPLRRGDTLFGIADLEGDWQLSTRVADRDSGYVLDNYGDADKEVSFVLNSDPQQHFHGKVTKISSVMESGAREESFLPVFVHVEKGIAKESNLGANAKAFFHCGSQPTWFVWCRPLVETIQKRVWLFFDGQPKSTEDSRHVD